MKFRTLAASVAAITGLSGVVVATAPADAAAPAPVLSIGTTTITVHTSNGMRWAFGLATSPNASSGYLTLHIARTTRRGSESHYWDVPLPTSALTFDRSTGRGRLKTPQSAAP